MSTNCNMPVRACQIVYHSIILAELVDVFEK